jgi:hypothetical protein
MGYFNKQKIDINTSITITNIFGSKSNSIGCTKDDISTTYLNRLSCTKGTKKKG